VDILHEIQAIFPRDPSPSMPWRTQLSECGWLSHLVLMSNKGPMLQSYNANNRRQPCITGEVNLTWLSAHLHALITIEYRAHLCCVQLTKILCEYFATKLHARS
jgi:hypothetical protein